jgi:hypothetical protein
MLDRISGINPHDVALFIPPGLKKFKLALFERIGAHIKKLGGQVVRHEYHKINTLPDEVIPIVGCTPEFREYIELWTARKRTWIYWDRGYMRRVFATWLPKGVGIGIPMGFYRWHINRPQMGQIYDVPEDRWKFLRLDERCEVGNQVKPWNRNGDHILIADTLPDYWKLFSDSDWTRRTKKTLQQYTSRPIRIRDKESKVPLYDDLRNAHCLVAHGSIAAVESVVMGCPVFVQPMSAAALVGKTNLSEVENPAYPERMKWLHSLAYCQFTEDELCDGTLWQLIR